MAKMETSEMTIEDQAKHIVQVILANAYQDRESYDNWRRNPTSLLREHGFDLVPETHPDLHLYESALLSPGLPDPDIAPGTVGSMWDWAEKEFNKHKKEVLCWGCRAAVFLLFGSGAQTHVTTS
jgi:hypothetical protein